MSDQQLITRSAFSRMCKVSPAAITKAIQNGTLEKASSGKYIDVNHPIAIDYLARKKENKFGRCRHESTNQKKKADKKKKLKKIKNDDIFSGLGGEDDPIPEPETKERIPRGREAAKIKRNLGAPPKKIDMIPADIREYGEMSFNKVNDIFGSDYRMKTWADGRMMLERIKKAQLENAKLAKELISFELVKRGIFDPMTLFFTRLMNDLPKTTTKTIIAKHKSGSTDLECEKAGRKEVEKLIKQVKRQLVKGLKSFE